MTKTENGTYKMTFLNCELEALKFSLFLWGDDTYNMSKYEHYVYYKLIR